MKKTLLLSLFILVLLSSLTRPKYQTSAYALAKYVDNNTLYITDPIGYREQHYASKGYIVESNIKSEFLNKLKQYGIKETSYTVKDIKVYFVNSIVKEGAGLLYRDDKLVTDRDISLSWRSKHVAHFKEKNVNPEIIFLNVSSKMEE